MEAKEIIKALQSCTSGDIYCKDCPYEDTPRCRYVSLVDALDLIMSQRLKIKNLESVNKQLNTDVFNANMNLERVTLKLQDMIQEDLEYPEAHYGGEGND